MELKCPRCQQKAFDEIDQVCIACGYEGKDLMELIGDYDIIVDNPKKHGPWAMFCSTFDAHQYMEKLKKEKPEIDWKVIKLDEWFNEYNGMK